jgi:hypothetical protein
MQLSYLASILTAGLRILGVVAIMVIGLNITYNGEAESRR